MFLFAVLSAGASTADLRPGKLADFRLETSPLLKRFVLAKPQQYSVDPLSDKPAEVVATLNCRFFHGPSEISYSVILFQSDEAFRAWDGKTKRSAPGWVSPLSVPERNGVREATLGGIASAKVARARALYSRRYLIRVAAFQHPEMLRRDPASKKRAFSDEELSRRMLSVKEELLRRVRSRAPTPSAGRKTPGKRSET